MNSRETERAELRARIDAIVADLEGGQE